jgi:hypothetical protein
MIKSAVPTGLRKGFFGADGFLKFSQKILKIHQPHKNPLESRRDGRFNNGYYLDATTKLNFYLKFREKFQKNP